MSIGLGPWKAIQLNHGLSSSFLPRALRHLGSARLMRGSIRYVSYIGPFSQKGGFPGGFPLNQAAKGVLKQPTQLSRRLTD